MAASVNDKFKKSGASTVTSLAAPGKALGATSITVGSTTNYPTDTGIIIAIRVVDTSGKLVAGTYTEWSATVTSATSLAIVGTPVYGSDQVYSAGSTTQVYIPVSSVEHNTMIDGLLVSHDQDGTLKAGAVDVAAVLANNVVTLPKINGGSTAGVLTTDASGNVTVGAKTTDANGWTVYNYGTWKEYVKKTANGAANKVQYEAWDLITETLPVGVVATDLKEVQVTPVYIDYTEFMGNINIRHTTTTNIVLRAASFRSGATPYQYAFYIKLKV